MILFGAPPDFHAKMQNNHCSTFRPKEERMSGVSTLPRPIATPTGWNPGLARLVLALFMIAAAAAAFIAVEPQATRMALQQDGASLTRLLRFMAGLKALLAACAAASVVWRLGAAASLGWFGAYALACAAMAAGPVLIWSLVHVGLGALLLHGGLLAVIVLLWRDPAVAEMLDAMLARRTTAFR
jgi:hypothetical protein